MEHIVEMDETENVDALQAGHTRGTENHIYGLSTHSLAGTAEDVLPLFLQASTSWQEHCKVPVGGHFVPYDQAKEHSKDTSSSTANAMQDQPGSTSISKFSRPAISVNLEMDQIADKVVERLTPMLTNIMQSINRLEHRQTEPSLPHLTHKQKEKQKCTRPSTSDEEEVDNQHNDPYQAIEQEEDSDLQAAIHASIVASGKSC
ncbi:hypothetical protein JVT61DRAFT_13414 [Boletus reticuloceps]|uniref:Uncharacterized protein n=1 Tax=Boletus reticuloceps TaxID=495285 RepID=A0A8I2YDK7_9AGAM|nr:hypothetical protein JVT61DRAFT_13414 [Boletus reticuloceps]